MAQLARTRQQLQKEAIIKVFNDDLQRFETVIVPSGITIGVAASGFDKGITLHGPLEFKTTAAPPNTSLKLYVVGSSLYFNGSEVGSGGGGGAPVDAQYVTLATDSTLTNERVLTAGSNITITDGGAGSTVTIAASAGAGGWTDDGTDVRLTTATDKVGIGTASPGASLEIEVSDSANRRGLFIDFNETSGYVALEVDSESTTHYTTWIHGKYGAYIQQDISSGRALKVIRDIAEAGSNPLADFVDDNTSNTQTTVRIQQDGAGDILNLYDGATEVFTVLDGGKVGIGTSSPSVELEIEDVDSSVYVRLSRNDSTMASGHELAAIQFAGTEDGSSYGIGASITGKTTEAWTVDSAEGTELLFKTTADGSATLQTRLTVGGDAVTIGNGSIGPGEIRLLEDTDLGSYYAGFKAGNLTENTIYEMPTAFPASNKILQSDSSGALTWVTDDDADGVGWISPGVGEIATTGSVAIGIATSPAERLEIEDADGTATTVQVSNTGGGDPQFSLAVAGTKKCTWGIDNDDSDKFKLGTTACSTGTVLTIDFDYGYAGFGTESPAEALEVETGAFGQTTTTIQVSNTATTGDPQLAFALSGTKKFTMGVDDSDSDKFKIGTTAVSTSTMLTINSSGYIGIGDATGPNSQFQIGEDAVSQQWSSATYPQVMITGVDNESEVQALKIQDEQKNEYFIVSSTGAGNSDVGKVIVGGTFGIGVASPMNRMQVNHSGSNGDDGIIIVRSDTSTGDTDLLGGIGFDSTDGNVPSSITEAAAFIAAYAAEAHGTGDKGGDLVFGTTTIDENDDTTSHEWMRILDSGKVGIGTASPAHALSVVGAVSASLGLSGSLTTLVDGTSYMVAGNNITITSSSNGAVTITGTATGAADVGWIGPSSGQIDTTGSVGVSGSLDVGEYIRHIGDTNTYIRFTDDNINIQAGGVDFIDIIEDGSQDQVVINQGAVDVDFRVESTNEPRGLFVDANANTFHVNYNESNFDTKIHNTNDVAITVNSAGVILNEDGHATNDFRVESDGHTHALFVDAGNNEVLLGANSTPGDDVFLFVSGTIGARGTSVSGSAVFGGDTVISGALYVSAPGVGQDVTFYGEDSDAIGLQWDADANEHGKLTLGTSGHGVDFTAYGETAGRYLNWDQSADTFYLWGSLNTRYDQVFDGSSQGWDFTVNSNSRVAIFVDGDQDQVYILSGGTGTSGNSPNPANATDLAFFVSGSIDSRDSSTKGTAVFGGDVVVSGTLSVNRSDAGGFSMVTVTTDGKVGIGTDNPGNKLSVGGNMDLGEYLYHKNDQDTFIRFQSDDIEIQAGGVDLIKMSEDGADTQVLILSGGAAASTNEASYTDTNFFVSGSTGSKDTSTRGTAVFGGDVVISGTLHGGTPLKIAGGMEVTGTMELKPSAGGIAIVRNPHGPVKLFASSALKLGSNIGTIDLLDLGDGAAGQILMKGQGALAERSIELNSPGTLFFTGTVGGAYFKGPMDVAGTIVPGADNIYDLGSPSRRYSNIYTGDLHLQNERGHWQIIEERDYLCVVNRLTGKRYKMALEPIDDDE